MCRQPLQMQELISSRVIYCMIEEAEVHCFSYVSSLENKIEKREESKEEDVEFCNWSGKLKEAERHYNQCQFARINCPNIACNDSYLRKSLTVHIQNCVYRRIPCKWCNRRKNIDLLDAHVLVCPKRPIPCPNNCLDINGVVHCLRPNDIVNHRTLCTMEIVRCRFVLAGCKKKLSRKDMPLHENDAAAHTGCLLDALQSVRTKICELDYQAAVIENLTSASKSQAKVIEALISDIERSQLIFKQLIFKVHISQLDHSINSTTINISGHNFRLNLEPKPANAGWHSLYFELLKDDDRVSSIDVELSLELVSHSALHPAYIQNAQTTYLEPECRGFLNYIKTQKLKDEVFVKDEQITIKAEITVK